MPRRKENIEFDPSVEEREKSFSLRDLIDGNVLTRKAVIKQSRFILLLVLIAFIFVVINLLVDLLYVRVDPRLRVSTSGGKNG